MRNVLKIVVTSVHLVACQLAPGDRYTVTVDPTFSPLEQEVTFTDFERWHEASLVTFDIRLGPCKQGAYTICLSPAATLGDNTHGLLDGNDHTQGSWNQHAELQILEGLPIEEFDSVVQHEIGHALGLEHTQSDTLMYYSINGRSKKADITCADIQQYKALRGQSWPCTENYYLTGQ